MPVAATMASVDAAISRWNGRLNHAADHILTATAQEDAFREPGKVFVSAEPAATTQAETGDAGQIRREVSAEQTFTGRTLAMARLERLQPMIEPILRRQGVPRALLAVVLIESGGRIDALSPKGARGIWQLMPQTARRYGLEVSGERDERLDPAMATRAAAHYLRDLYGRFGDWRLVLAAYNAGEHAVEAAMQRAQSGSFTVLSERRLLPAETRDYVPAVLRASEAFGPLRTERAKAEPGGGKGSIQFALVSFDPALRGQEVDSLSAPDGAAERSD